MGRKISQEEFVCRMSNISPNITIVGEYVNMHTKIECKCDKGHTWFPLPMDLVKGSGCLKCGVAQRVSKRTKSHDTFVEEVRKINPDIKVLGSYVNSRTKIDFLCPNGHVWHTTPDSVLSGKSCLICTNIQSSIRQRKSQEQFVKEVKELHPDITVLGEYVNSNTKIEFLCSKGHTWKTVPDSILNGCSCPVCGNERSSLAKLKTHEQFIEDLKKVTSEIIILSKYEKASKKVSCRCKKCEHEWKATPNNLLRGYGCPKCIHSKGEKAIEEYFKAHNIYYESQKRFLDCVDKRPLPFDFYLPQYNMAIEYQGEQHYKPIKQMGDEEKFAYCQKHDGIKREYCKDKGINLLEIPYTKFKNIAEILNCEIGGDKEWENQSV